MSDGISHLPSRLLLTPSEAADLDDTSLVPPTAQVHNTALPSSTPILSPPSMALNQPPMRMLLYPSGCPEPLVLDGTEFVLGRMIEHDRSNTVDLSPYRGYVLGVSRQHALVTATSDGYTIKDLGSANGTWLNGMRLSGFVPYPLSDGDQIQLGRLLLTLRFIFSETLPQ